MLTRTTLTTTTLAIFVAAVLHSSVPSDALQSPFSGLNVSWSGDGFIKLASGQRERLRCRVTCGVTESDTRLQQCASDSYRFDVDSKHCFRRRGTAWNLKRNQPQRLRVVFPAA